MTAYYEIHLQGHLDEDWADWFGDFIISHQPDGITQLVGSVQDQAALHGLFIRLRDLGMTILKVQTITKELYHEKTMDRSPT